MPALTTRHGRSLADLSEHCEKGASTPTPKRLAYKGNRFVEASYRLTLHEHRLLLLAISKIHRRELVTSEQRYRISVGEYGDFFSLDRRSVYNSMTRASQSLVKRQAGVVIEADEYIERKLIRLVAAADYISQEGVIELRFHDELIPFISDLKHCFDGFTGYALVNMRRFTSIYSIRLYELLRQWIKTARQRTIDVDWLRSILCLDGAYGRFNNLRQRVILPAIDEINEHSDLKVSWTPIKRGNKVQKILIDFVPKSELRRDGGSSVRGHDSVRGFPKAVLEEHARPGETYDQVAQRLGEDERRRKADDARLLLAHRVRR